MQVQLRGVIAVGAGTRSVEVVIPAEGIPLSRVLSLVVDAQPRTARYLAGGGAPLRVILNEEAVPSGADPRVLEGDSLTLLSAIAGGSGCRV